MAKKAAKKKAKKARVKRGKDTRFKPGVRPSVGTPFEKGNTAGVGHGRPPSIGSPRARLKHYAECKAPEKLRRAIAKAYPELTKKELDGLSWADAIALSLLAKSASGDVSAAALAIKNIDDSGRERTQIEFGEDARVAARDFTEGIARLAQRIDKNRVP